MTLNKAFDTAKKVILYFHPSAIDFCLERTEVKNENWHLEIRYLDRAFYWNSKIFVPKIGECVLQSSRSID